MKPLHSFFVWIIYGKNKDIICLKKLCNNFVLKRLFRLEKNKENKDFTNHKTKK